MNRFEVGNPSFLKIYPVLLVPPKFITKLRNCRRIHLSNFREKVNRSQALYGLFKPERVPCNNFQR